MGEPRPDEEKMRKRAEALMGDYIFEREELREGPRFHVPPFVEKRIEGTKTVFYMPADAEEVEAPARLPARSRPPAGEIHGRNVADERPPAELRTSSGKCVRSRNCTAIPREADQRSAESLVCPDGQTQEAGGLHPIGAAWLPPPKGGGLLSDERTAPPAPVEPAATVSGVPAVTVAPKPAAVFEPLAPAARQPQPDATENVAPAEEEAWASPPPTAEPARQAPYEFPAKLTSEPSRPVSFRKPYVRPDTTGPRRPSTQSLQRRPSAKDLIARLRVVKEGVETREQVLQRMAGATAPAQQDAPVDSEAGQDGEAAPGQAAQPAAGVPPREARLAPAPGPVMQKEQEQKAEGGKLCPSCGSPISDKNRLLICSSCGKVNCDTCGRYDLAHLKTDIYYEYKFDFPLCLQCYGNAFSIQRLLGRAGVCYGNGNYTYALYYSNQALEQDPESKYAPKARDLVAKINKAHEQAHERDQEWRLQRKQFVSRNRQEDPSWR